MRSSKTKALVKGFAGFRILQKVTAALPTEKTRQTVYCCFDNAVFYTTMPFLPPLTFFPPRPAFLFMAS